MLEINNKGTSLFYEVFKSKYFRYGSLLNATIGNNSSWAWRSLLEGRKVIEKGAKWQVGKGDKIDIHSDPWVSSSYPFSLRSNTCQSQNLHLVKQLMNEDGTCNENIIRSSFEHEVAEIILQTAPTRNEDKLIWQLERNGTYSVHLGYKVAFRFFHPPWNLYRHTLRTKNYGSRYGLS